jgi:hypothetical protein
MSRFNFSIIAIVCACCLFTVACEKEDYTPANMMTTDKYAVEEASYNPATLTNERAAIRATEVLAKLHVSPVFAATNTHVIVTAKRPEDPKLRYFDLFPAATATQDNPTSGLAIDCPYGDCEDQVPSLVARYQDIAKAQCVDQYLSVTCCAEGETVYIVVYIAADCLPAQRR